MRALIPVEIIEKKILLIRGEKVMLDADLAELYEVETFNLNKAVKRNIDRFPQDFMFQLTKEEADSLRFQIGILKPGEQAGTQSETTMLGRGQHRKYLPYVFTEQGVAMLSSVLNSERAVKVNIEIMRAFVSLRQMLASNAELARKLDALEKKYDAQFKIVFDAIRKLVEVPEKPKRRIGFKSPVDEGPTGLKKHSIKMRKRHD